MAVLSPTLAADERIRRRLAAGEPVVHLAFGEAGLPVPESVREALARGSADNAYGPVAGSLAAREAAKGYFERRQLPTAPEQIVFAPGSKALLFALVSLLDGDVVLPRPAWVSYAAQAALAGKRVWPAPISERGGGVPDPERFQDVLDDARARGGRPGVVILTLPDNPTGTLACAEDVRRVAELAAANDLRIVSDEIYRDLAHAPAAFLSPAEVAPERTYVTSGLSKSMALGGWRIGFVRLPPGDDGACVRALASEVWSSLAAPMQHVAAYVLREPADVVEHVARSRELHRRVVGAAYERLVAAGARCRPPGGAFYLYPDLEPLRERFDVDGADALAELLLDRFGIGVLTGTAFGDDPRALRFRLATSLLYGRDDEQRRAALSSEDPAALPWIHEPLDRLAAALASTPG